MRLSEVLSLISLKFDKSKWPTWGNCHVWDNGEEEMTNILKMVNFKVHKFIVAYVKDILLRSIYSED